MKFYKLTKEDKELIKEAKKVIKKNYRNDKLLASTVGSILITNKNKIYKGVSIHSKTSGSTSICSEMASISQMVSDGGRKIKTIVAYSNKRRNVISPCGACRHIMSQFGNPFVIISKSNKVKLNDLYPMQ